MVGGLVGKRMHAVQADCTSYIVLTISFLLA